MPDVPGVPAYVVDAFTDAAFRGNPAGVVVLDGQDADAGWMQRVAAELRHSETAFVRPRADGTHDLRWFTPAVEVDLCGHATLAAAHVLYERGATGPVAFQTRSGVLTVARDGDALAMDFPAVASRSEPVPAALADALGVAVDAVLRTGNDDLVVELADAAAVAALCPDVRALAAVPCRGVVATAQADDGDDADFVSRWFGPRVGVDEDPVTGSAHCALAPHWASRLGSRLVGRQLSARGGLVGTELQDGRVVLRGRAVTVLAGVLTA